MRNSDCHPDILIEAIHIKKAAFVQKKLGSQPVHDVKLTLYGRCIDVILTF